MGKLTIVGNYVNIPNEENTNQGGSGQIISFIGKMNYEPNILAVEYFCEFVFPKLLKYYPNAKFNIVGAHPDKRVLKLRSLSNVVVTGFVESIEPYFINSSIIVAPMLTGSGIQNKIIQAMAHGCCVITSPTGAEGLDVTNSGISICRTTEEWIKSISTFLKDKELRIRKGKQARNYVASNMSKDIIRKQFLSFIY